MAERVQVRDLTNDEGGGFVSPRVVGFEGSPEAGGKGLIPSDRPHL